MSTEASTRLNALYEPIRDELARLEVFLEREFAAEEPFILKLLKHVRRFRGKRIRPAVLLLVGKGAGVPITDDHIKIAGVLELIHTATLVHDDILDGAEIRRNVETLHRRWGERAAVLMGDFIYSRAFALSTEVPGMAQVLSRTTNVICEGELLQIRHRFQPDFREDVYLQIIRKKTAILYAVACELGARLSGFDASDGERLHRFGLDVGMAFQVIDDCMDYDGDETIVGKSLGTDLPLGKVTLPLIYLLRSVPESERTDLLQTLSCPMSAETEATIAARVRASGALERSLERAEGYVQAARTCLAGFPVTFRECVEPVSEYVIRRQR